MQLIKEEEKIYILFTNAEDIKDKEGFNGWDALHGGTWGNPIYNILPYNIAKEKVVIFHGPEGSVRIKIDKVHKVNRVIPNEITARSYWGEFRRSHPYSQRCNKLIHLENSFILEGTPYYHAGENSEVYEFHQIQILPELMHPDYSHNQSIRQKTWNLSLDRSLGPNLKDYSTNDCYKYYTLL